MASVPNRHSPYTKIEAKTIYVIAPNQAVQLSSLKAAAIRMQYPQAQTNQLKLETMCSMQKESQLGSHPNQACRIQRVFQMKQRVLKAVAIEAQPKRWSVKPFSSSQSSLWQPQPQRQTTQPSLTKTSALSFLPYLSRVFRLRACRRPCPLSTFTQADFLSSYL